MIVSLGTTEYTYQPDLLLQVRKKGRNKQHATNCRIRKDQEIKTLQVIIKLLRKQGNKDKAISDDL